eukprot:5601678-Pleurochrysis_carterae.AAC.2
MVAYVTKASEFFRGVRRTKKTFTDEEGCRGKAPCKVNQPPIHQKYAQYGGHHYPTGVGTLDAEKRTLFKYDTTL